MSRGLPYSFLFNTLCCALAACCLVYCTTPSQDQNLMVLSKTDGIESQAIKPTCSSESPKGELCTARLQNLRPTQFCVGYQDVQRKRMKLSSGTPTQDSLSIYSAKNPGLAVIGPEDIIYLLDGHHRARALVEVSADLFHVKILDDFSHLTMVDFWDTMISKKFVWLFDCEGRGPLSPLDLPESLQGLKDDPYRTLAEDAQDRGANKKLDVLYQEFYWANFYRSRIPTETVAQNYEAALTLAIQLAKMREAKDLPGFNGPQDP